MHSNVCQKPNSDICTLPPPTGLLTLYMFISSNHHSCTDMKLNRMENWSVLKAKAQKSLLWRNLSYRLISHISFCFVTQNLLLCQCSLCNKQIKSFLTAPLLLRVHKVKMLTKVIYLKRLRGLSSQFLLQNFTLDTLMPSTATSSHVNY